MLVCLDFGDDGYEDGVAEITRLAASAGARRSKVVRGKRQRPDSKLYAGSGKVEEIGLSADELNAATVIFNHSLSPGQQRNLEKELGRKVLDRTELILRIFAQRAKTNEGKLQVELAQLEHLSTRLVRGWTHLERQRGGLGKTGGPGEKQIELDRRMISARMRMLKEKLVQLGQRREVQRRARSRRDVFSVALVGYTNAGKSTLFNALTHANAHAKAYVADKLFATLDTTISPTRSASSATCRTGWWPLSAPRWRKRCAPTCCCTWWTAHPRRARAKPRTSTRCWPRYTRRRSRSWRSGTRPTFRVWRRGWNAMNMVGFAVFS